MRYLLILFVLFLGCGKNDDSSAGCEKWEFYHTCTPRNLPCQAQEANQQAEICGSDLEDARAGRTTTINDDEDYLRIRHYVKKVN